MTYLIFSLVAATVIGGLLGLLCLVMYIGQRDRADQLRELTTRQAEVIGGLRYEKAEYLAANNLSSVKNLNPKLGAAGHYVKVAGLLAGKRAIATFTQHEWDKAVAKAKHLAEEWSK